MVTLLKFNLLWFCWRIWKLYLWRLFCLMSAQCRRPSKIWVHIVWMEFFYLCWIICPIKSTGQLLKNSDEELSIQDEHQVLRQMRQENCEFVNFQLRMPSKWRKYLIQMLLLRLVKEISSGRDFQFSSSRWTPVRFWLCFCCFLK